MAPSAPSSTYRINSACICAAFVGRLGAAQLGAVGLSSIIFNFCGMIFNFLVVVTTPTVAAAVAQRDFQRVRTHTRHNACNAHSTC